MTKNECYEKLKTSNNILNEIIKIYFINNAHLTYPQIGVRFFKDVASKFKFAIREYSITHSRKIKACQSPNLRQLLRYNEISISNIRELAKNTDNLLELFTDFNCSTESKRCRLESQLKDFINNFDLEDYEKEKSAEKQIYNKLNTDDLLNESKNIYLDSVIKSMKAAELNQIDNNKYLVVEKLINTYIAFEYEYVFKEKKKYLQNIKDTSKQRNRLKKDICEIISENGDENKEKSIKTIRNYIFYLIYDKNKTHIYMIHSILGYKYKEGLKFYQKLFLKDHSTGRIDFLLSYNPLSVIYEDLESLCTKKDNENQSLDFNSILNEVLYYLNQKN